MAGDVERKRSETSEESTVRAGSRTVGLVQPTVRAVEGNQRADGRHRWVHRRTGDSGLSHRVRGSRQGQAGRGLRGAGNPV